MESHMTTIYGQQSINMKRAHVESLTVTQESRESLNSKILHTKKENKQSAFQTLHHL